MNVQIHNTLTRRKDRLEPIEPGHVRLYVCGPTVYQRIHIGNARPLIVFDTLVRLLRHLYPKVTYVRNITDIEDKIIAQAEVNGETIAELTERTAAAFAGDCAALGCASPDHEPRATAHIDGMIAIIETLVGRGHAYAADGHVLFNVPSMPAYGRLSGRSRDDQIAGARVEVAPYKRDPADFVLWKPSDGSQPGWDSPWGRGRPGWHIECSAMSESLLGVPFDIHGGGIDLVFPHHENEMAQTCCASGEATMASIWMHNGFVDMSGEKMSKSLGNVVRVDEALALADPSPVRQGEIIRFWMLGAHYRQPIDFTADGLRQARAQLDRFYGALERAGEATGRTEPDDAVVAALADDMNTPQAIAVLHEILGDLNRAKFAEKPAIAGRLRASAALMGLLQADATTWLRGDDGGDEERVAALVQERIDARKARNFARADEIRNQLNAEGIVLEDGPGGTTWRRA
ncbi:MAG: cysteine--tRNA ligase [Geminicoccaceae bacterium]|nr:cysteine--tRNA ligase [Geminicoccaceae bacterium]